MNKGKKELTALTISSTNKEELVKQATEAVKSYEAALNEEEYAGTLEYHVSSLFGFEKLVDNVLDYKLATLHLLASLARPETSKLVQDELGGFTYGVLISMLTRMNEFCQMMNQENFLAHFKAYQLENFGSDYSPEQLEEIIDSYSRKIRGVKKPAAISKAA